MYPVTQSYIDAVRAPSRTDRLVGSLTFSDGEEMELTESVIGMGSVKIKKACLEKEELQFGTAILSELKLSLRSDENRYRFYGAKISLTYGIKTDNGWYDLPLGVYTVAEPDRKQNLVTLLAYDNLITLDKEYGGKALYGTPFDIMTAICEECGVPLGMTEEEMLAFPNGNQIIQIDETSGVTTYRGAAKVLAQMMACIIVADSSGNIVFRRYGREAVATLERTNRYSLTAADYVVKYVGVTIRGASKEFSSYDIAEADGLEMKILDAPAWDYGDDSTLQMRTDNVLEELRYIEYTPVNMVIPGDPALECGDILKLVVDDGYLTTMVTDMTWIFRGRMTVKSTGTNPYNHSIVPQKSQTIRELEHSTDNRKLIFYSFTNHNALTVTGSDAREISQVIFVTSEVTSALFMAQLPLYVEASDTIVTESTDTTNTVNVKDQDGKIAEILDADGNPLTLTVVTTDTTKTVTHGYIDIQIEYYLDGHLIEYELIQRLHAGKHILSLVYTFDSLDGESNYQWVVKIKIVGGSGKATVAKQAFRATVTGQGMAGTDAWDGSVTCDEMVPSMNIVQRMGFEPFVDTVTSADAELPTPIVYNENPPASSMSQRMTFEKFIDNVTVNQVILNQVIDTSELSLWTFDRKYIREVDSILLLETE